MRKRLYVVLLGFALVGGCLGPAWGDRSASITWGDSSSHCTNGQCTYGKNAETLETNLRCALPWN